jgi:hypothetical protein
MGSGTSVGNHAYPAKFSFSPIANPSCANDYVGYITRLAGSSTQASILAFNNLYPGASQGCGTSGVPTVDWAYNTGGTIVTSPVLSIDGSQLAFVHTPFTRTDASSLVLLKWAASPATHSASGTLTEGSPTITGTGGSIAAGDVGAQLTGTGIPSGTTISAVTATTATMSADASSGGATSITVEAETYDVPGAPPVVTGANYRTCTAPCMTTITFSTTEEDQANDDNSAPYYDYTNDIIYVSDYGNADTNIAPALHKFTGVRLLK